MVSTLKVLVQHGRAPLYVSWVVTNHCNLRCEYCACPDIAGKELSTEQCLSLLDGMAELGTRQIKFTGGEPLVRKDLPQLLARAEEHGIATSLNSNGTLVPRMLDRLRSLRSISLSLDGAALTHNGHRGDGQFQEVIAACEALRETRIEVHLQCLVTARTTENAIDSVLDTADSFAYQASFQPALDVELGTSKPNPVAPSAQRVRELMRYIVTQKTSARPVAQSVAALNELARWPEEKNLSCLVGRVACRLDPDGMLTPCYERVVDVPAVSAVKLGFVEAFTRIQRPTCTECWGAGRVEMRLATQLNPSALANIITKG